MSGQALGAKLHPMYAPAGHAFELKASGSARSMPAITGLGLPPGEHERDVRRRYQAAIAAAIESLRHAEQRFDESSAAIDVHIQRALAAVSFRASRVVVSGRERRKPDVVAATLATAEAVPA
jgi:hypothetical protein